MGSKRNKKSLSEKNIKFLIYLNSLPRQKQIKIIKIFCNQGEINSLLEIIINFLNNNIKCKTSFIKKFSKYKNYFTKLIKKSNSIRKKRGLLSSKVGGFLVQSILALALPLLTKLFSQ